METRNRIDIRRRLCLATSLLLALGSVDTASSQVALRTLDLNEGDLCRRGEGLELDSVCMRGHKCRRLEKDENNNFYEQDICAYDGNEPIVCCPTAFEEPVKAQTPSPSFISSTADKMCIEYSRLSYNEPDEYVLEPIIDDEEQQNIHINVFGGKKIENKEFPHMAVLGYGETQEKKLWGCGGSLISNRWILTAGHCMYMGHLIVRWARLGMSTVGKKNGLDHQIKTHLVPPSYKSPSLYNDIALLRLKTVVQFSKYIKPICLNTDELLNPRTLVATSWGRTSGRVANEETLRVELNIIPAKQCNRVYFLNSNLKQLESGIAPDTMMCGAARPGGKNNACQGDTGGPLQIEHSDRPGMYLQIGIMSFGKLCGDENAPGVFTKVAKYIPWIEASVWPKSKF